jgi:mannose-6-phosphate isomerase
LKEIIFKIIKNKLQSEGFSISSFDENRPWGGFFVIDESEAQEFANHYFDGIDVSTLKISGKLSPKILIVAPNQRLSWQYHHRRAEIWRLIDGEAGIVRSQNDTEGKLEIFKKGDTITLKQGERHRLVGLEDWAVIAEIWQHTDSNEPSDENDIVRVQDDFGR